MRQVVVVGAGPAGLSAALMLAEHGVSVDVLDRESSPAGLRTSESWGGFRFQFGIHPFSTTNPLLESLLKSLLGDDLLVERPRRALFAKGTYLDPSTTPAQMLKTLGAEATALGWAGFILSRRLQGRSPETMAEYSSLMVGPWNHESFIDPLARKVWGNPSTALSAPEKAVSWPRPQSLSASMSTVLSHLLPNRWGVVPLAPIYAPKLGWSHLARLMIERLEAKGGRVRLGAEVSGIRFHDGRVAGILMQDGEELPAEAAILSNTLDEWVPWVAPAQASSPAAGLHHRHSLLVGLALAKPVRPLMDYHTVDITDPALPAVSIHTPGCWDSSLAGENQILLESFVGSLDPLWKSPDDEVVRQMLHGCEALGFFSPNLVKSSKVVRLPKAAPAHTCGGENIRLSALALADTYPNLALCGRALFSHIGVDGNMESGFRAALQTVRALGIS